MKIEFINYPKCSTCVKAKKWLENNKIKFEDRNIVTDNPSFEELKEYFGKTDKPLKRIFNTSGMVYREMNLKDKLADMSEDEMLSLLATNGMLVKRPLIVTEKKVLIGFKEEEWKEFFQK